jgi:hypothetical protein
MRRQFLNARVQNFSADSGAPPHDAGAVSRRAEIVNVRKRKSGLSALVAALAVVAALAFAPAAMARGHLSIGISLPGIGIGYSDCRHCGGWRGYAGVYGGYYPSAYYAPAYYPARTYYPSYYDYGYYAAPVVYYDGYRSRGRHVGHRGYGYRDYGHRAGYYDHGSRHDHRDGRGRGHGGYYHRGH